MNREPPWRRELGVVLAVGMAAVLLVGCGGSGSGHATRKSTGATDASPAGDIPDTQAYVRFVSPDGTYSLKVPEGWARAQTGAVTVFADKFNSVRVEALIAPPTAASATGDEIAAIAAATPGFKLGNVSTVKRTAGDARRVTYRAESGRDAVTGKSVRLAVERYELTRNGRQVTITLSAPVGSDNVDPWKTITNSFRWTT